MSPATKSIDSGAALRKLEELRAFSKKLMPADRGWTTA
jgi:hypothetical protein